MSSPQTNSQTENSSVLCDSSGSAHLQASSNFAGAKERAGTDGSGGDAIVSATQEAEGSKQEK